MPNWWQMRKPSPPQHTFLTGAAQSLASRPDVSEHLSGWPYTLPSCPFCPLPEKGLFSPVISVPPSVPDPQPPCAVLTSTSGLLCAATHWPPVSGCVHEHLKLNSYSRSPPTPVPSQRTAWSPPSSTQERPCFEMSSSSLHIQSTMPVNFNVSPCYRVSLPYSEMLFSLG